MAYELCESTDYIQGGRAWNEQIIREDLGTGRFDIGSGTGPVSAQGDGFPGYGGG